ncbi:MAG: class I SAM-dependent methyltransferase [Tepidisphaeraceae bacterium]
MVPLLHRMLGSPTLYHLLRHGLLGGLPFRQWVTLYGLDDPKQRVADLGCGPADILRYVAPANQPEQYVGIDFDADYLRRAEELAGKLKLNARFVNIDLTRLTHDAATQQSLVDLLTEHRINRVLLLGVMHHLDDVSTRTTLDLLASVPTVQTVVTQDVAVVPGHGVNNFLAARDRGQFVRTQEQYEGLLASTRWPGRQLSWTRPGFRVAKYIHFTLSR